jgi:hypothetical protein
MQIQQESAFSNFAAEKSVARMQLEKVWGEIALRDQFDEELQGIFVGRGSDGIGTLCSNAIVLKTQRGVLSRAVIEWAAGINPQDAQIMSKISAIENSRSVVFFCRTNYLC